MAKVDPHLLERRFESRHPGLEVADRVLESVGSVGGLDVLDVGCGGGELCAALIQRGGRVRGVDLCATLTARARAAAPDAGFARADALALPFADERFDVASSVLVLHYLGDPGRSLAEIRRVLRPGGRLVACDRVCSADPVLRAAQIGVERLRNPLLQRMLSPDQLEETLEGAGFEIVRMAEFRRRVSLDAWLEGTDPARASEVREEVASLRGRDLGGLRVASMDRIEVRLALAEARRPA